MASRQKSTTASTTSTASSLMSSDNNIQGPEVVLVLDTVNAPGLAAAHAISSSAKFGGFSATQQHQRELTCIVLTEPSVAAGRHFRVGTGTSTEGRGSSASVVLDPPAALLGVASSTCNCSQDPLPSGSTSLSSPSSSPFYSSIICDWCAADALRAAGRASQFFLATARAQNCTVLKLLVSSLTPLVDSWGPARTSLFLQFLQKPSVATAGGPRVNAVVALMHEDCHSPHSVSTLLRSASSCCRVNSCRGIPGANVSFQWERRGGRTGRVSASSLMYFAFQVVDGSFNRVMVAEDTPTSNSDEASTSKPAQIGDISMNLNLTDAERAQRAAVVLSHVRESGGRVEGPLDEQAGGHIFIDEQDEFFEDGDMDDLEFDF